MKIEFEALHKQILVTLSDIKHTLDRVDSTISKLNGRVGKTERDISLIRGIGIATTVFITIAGLTLHILKGA